MRYYHAGNRVLFIQRPGTAPVQVSSAESEAWAKRIAQGLNRTDYYNKQDLY